MRALIAVLLVQVVLGATFAALAATGNIPFTGGDDEGEPAGASSARLIADGFNEEYAFRWLRRQVRMGPRPAGSRTSRRLARDLRDVLPEGRFQRVPGGLRNVVGRVEGRDPSRYIVVGAHYDTKDLPGFVGANDAAGGTAAVIELARQVRRTPVGPTVVFVLFDGEEAPRGTPDSQFAQRGLRGSKVAARRYDDAEAMILLDFVADKRLSIPREESSDEQLWARLRAAAFDVGAQRWFPDRTGQAIIDDHTPFLAVGVPSINLIDFDFPCWHRTCDNLSAVSQSSLDVSGETVLELLRRL